MHRRANGREGGGKTFEGLVGGVTPVSDGYGDKLKLFLVVLDCRDEGRLLSGVLGDLVIGTEVPAESDLYDEDGACLPVEEGRVWKGGIKDPLGVDEVRGCALILLKK